MRLTGRFELNGDVSITYFKGDYTPHESPPRWVSEAGRSLFSAVSAVYRMLCQQVTQAGNPPLIAITGPYRQTPDGSAECPDHVGDDEFDTAGTRHMPAIAAGASPWPPTATVVLIRSGKRAPSAAEHPVGRGCSLASQYAIAVRLGTVRLMVSVPVELFVIDRRRKQFVRTALRRSW